MTLNFEKKEKFLATVFSHNQQLINLADSKSNIVLRLIAFLIPLIFGLNAYSTIGFTSKVSVISLLNISAFISIIFLGISFIFSIQAIRARLKSSDNNNLLFFGNLAKKPLSEFIGFFDGVDENDLVSQYCTEIKDISEINEKKYKNHRKSIWFLGAGISVISISYVIAILINLF